MGQSRFAAVFEPLGNMLGDRFTTGASMLDLHGRDEAYTEPHRPDAVVFPENTAEVVEIVRICAAHRCPIVPFGIGSSLEGHVIPVNGGVSVDFTRMDRVLEVRPQDLDAVVQPGVTRTRLNSALRSHGLMFTVDPGADASMGGMAATRASGTNTVMYGTMRENVLAMEVVLADGRVIRTGSRARKSSAGYDLNHLFIGSEGTLGLMTELTVRLHGIPETIVAASCAFGSIADAVDAVIAAIQCGLPLARVELLDALQITACNSYGEALSLPEIPHLFVEFHGSEASVRETIAQFTDLAEGFGMSGFAAASRPEERNRLWAARHDAYPAARALRPGCRGMVTDCCVPISALAECIARARAEADSLGLIAPILGHVGDGNFHMVVLIDPERAEELVVARTLADRVNRIALDLGGTVTGEHGVGLGKKGYMRAQHGEAYGVMSDLKRALDPLNILNPGKLVDLGT